MFHWAEVILWLLTWLINVRTNTKRLDKDWKRFEGTKKWPSIGRPVVYLVMGKVRCANQACYLLFRERYSTFFNGTEIWWLYWACSHECAVLSYPHFSLFGFGMNTYYPFFRLSHLEAHSFRTNAFERCLRTWMYFYVSYISMKTSKIIMFREENIFLQH